jgi:hypothetical protein
MRTAPGAVALASARAPALDNLPAALDPSTASFRALALQVRAMGLLDRRPGYYRVKITLTIVAFFAGWALFVLVGNSWAALAVAPLVGIMFTQLGFLGHDLGHNQVFCARRRNHLLGLVVANTLIGLSFGWWVPKQGSSWPQLARRAFSHRGWPGGRRRFSSRSCCCAVWACTYSGSSGLRAGETGPRR